jgi:hypothetical protein
MLAICGMMTSAIPSSTTIEESTEVVEQVLSVKPQLKQEFKRNREFRKIFLEVVNEYAQASWILVIPHRATWQSKLFILHQALIFYG